MPYIGNEHGRESYNENIKGNHKSYVAQAEAELNARMNPVQDRYWYGFVAGAVVGAFIMFVIAGNLYLMSVGV